MTNPTPEERASSLGISDKLAQADIAAAIREAVEVERAALKLPQDKIISGPPLEPEDLLARLERRMGSMKLIGERDDLLLDAAIFVASVIRERGEK